MPFWDFMIAYHLLFLYKYVIPGRRGHYVPCQRNIRCYVAHYNKSIKYSEYPIKNSSGLIRLAKPSMTAQEQHLEIDGNTYITSSNWMDFHLPIVEFTN